MWLAIDDERSPKVDVIARTVEAGTLMLMAAEWEGLVLDHDLGQELSGYDILSWALEKDILPPIVQLVTSNPSGRERMALALESNGYTTKNRIEYVKTKES